MKFLWVAGLLLLQPTGAIATSPDESAARAVIARGYGAYHTGKKSDGFYHLLSPALRKAWDRILEEEGVLDADPFCNCQDYDDVKFRHRIVGLEMKGASASAEVDVDIGFPAVAGKSPWQRFRLSLVRTSKRWLIDDLSSAQIRSLKSGIWQSRSEQD